MTYKDVIDSMNGKTFYSERFGEEMVTVESGVVVGESGLLQGLGVVVGESGLLHGLTTRQDVRDLRDDYLKTL